VVSWWAQLFRSVHFAPKDLVFVRLVDSAIIPLTRTYLTNYVYGLMTLSKINPQKYKGISTRRGGLDASAGLPIEIPLELARWKQLESLRRYRAKPVKRLAKYTRTLLLGVNNDRADMVFQRGHWRGDD
jgi:hypothetical protein